MTGKIRVLLVEDHSVLAEAIAEFLRLSGLDVQVAGTGEEALQAVRAFRPEIVLCDLRLPDMSGVDLLRRLRASPWAKNAVLAVHTAMGEFDLRRMEREANVQADLFLTKPLTQEKLRRLLDGLKSKRQAAG
jgi:CheY-like chemotaxis protein